MNSWRSRSSQTELVFTQEHDGGTLEEMAPSSSQVLPKVSDRAPESRWRSVIVNPGKKSDLMSGCRGREGENLRRSYDGKRTRCSRALAKGMEPKRTAVGDLLKDMITARFFSLPIIDLRRKRNIRNVGILTISSTATARQRDERNESGTEDAPRSF